jgi:hypothetical protein
MRRSVVVVATLWSCSSPDVCDQHVVDDVVAMSMLHDDHGPAFHTVGAVCGRRFP